MKNHPAWLAAGVLVFVVLACNLSKNSNSNSGGSGSGGTAIKEIHMAKDNNGAPGTETDSFEAGDHTVHCVATLAEAKSGTQMKFSWWIVDAGGSKDEKIKDIDYTTGALENVIHGHLTLPKDWPVGKYKVEVYVNGALDKTVSYSVK